MSVDTELQGILEKINIFDESDQMIKGYLQEARECLKNELPRSSILLFWSIFMYEVYKKINMYGVAEFLDLVNSKNLKYNGTISSLNDLNKLKDSDILHLCHEIGFYDQNVKGLLQVRLNYRNSVAHVSQVKLHRYAVFEFISDICEYSKIIHSLELKPDPTFLETVRRMDKESLLKMMKKMAFSKMKSYVEKIFDRLAEIKSYPEYQENVNLYTFVIECVGCRESEVERTELFGVLFTRGFLMSGIGWGAWDIYDKIFELTKFSYIQKFILDNNYLDQLVVSFCDSPNYSYAGNSAQSLTNFIHDLKPAQINNIANARLRNSQISSSFTAEPKVKKILVANKEKIDGGTLEQLRSVGIEI